MGSPEGTSRRPLALVVTEDRAALAGFAGVVAVITGSFLEWASVPLGPATVPVAGVEADGKITLVAGCAALILLVAAFRVRGRDLPVAAAAAGLASAAVAFAYLRNLEEASARVLERILATNAELDPSAVASRFGAHAGPGAWTVLAGGVVIAAACVVLLVRDRGESRP